MSAIISSSIGIPRPVSSTAPRSASLNLPAKHIPAGTTYRDFIASLHLPNQLADVDPIVASFCGGAVGVLSALLLVEINNAKVHNKQRCLYCEVGGCRARYALRRRACLDGWV